MKCNNRRLFDRHTFSFIVVHVNLLAFLPLTSHNECSGADVSWQMLLSKKDTELVLKEKSSVIQSIALLFEVPECCHQ